MTSHFGYVELRIIRRIFSIPLDFEITRLTCTYLLLGKSTNDNDSKYCYQPAGHIVIGDLKIITDSRIRSIICKGPKYRFPVPIDLKSCREEIAGALQEFCNRWCKREHVESNALNSWKLNIFKIIDGRISFYCNNLDLLPPKPKFTFRHKKGIQEFHRRFVLAPADKAADNDVVV